ncbi:MAG: hypothetical protein EA344_00770 [Alkalicoccus sp.]|nr:MAG: hypothetical protein EA344_00770 [Alkalicoccus sp.]
MIPFIVGFHKKYSPSFDEFFICAIVYQKSDRDSIEILSSFDKKAVLLYGVSRSAEQLFYYSRAFSVA